MDRSNNPHDRDRAFAQASVVLLGLVNAAGQLAAQHEPRPLGVQVS
ncbi:hypothetical protein O7627_11610 [Solwaraspora sp. WMMD1047]|nr:hypothetical protein [Solwaraspora sp. WMMD1047]MDG4829946.1 hypothetical protein [Solwaraspora sp. WMMD1047]